MIDCQTHFGKQTIESIAFDCQAASLSGWSQNLSRRKCLPILDRLMANLPHHRKCNQSTCRRSSEEVKFGSTSMIPTLSNTRFSQKPKWMQLMPTKVRHDLFKDGQDLWLTGLGRQVVSVGKLCHAKPCRRQLHWGRRCRWWKVQRAQPSSLCLMAGLATDSRRCPSCQRGRFCWEGTNRKID